MMIDTDGAWGWIDGEGVFRPVPIHPLLMAGFGPPPFDVTLPSGEARRIVAAPADPKPAE